MLIKVRTGAFDAESDALEPNGEELWSGGDDDLSAAVLSALHNELEVGTWLKLDNFFGILAELQSHEKPEIVTAVTVKQSGVSSPWSATIEIGATSAALMICRAVVEHVRRLRPSADLWVRFE